MLKEALGRLSEEDIKLLRCALEHGIAQYIDLGDGYYIGVNITNMQVLESIGDWCYGRLP